MLTASELSRYARQVVLPEIGVAGQERLRAARVLLVGAGGLGSPTALYLAAAGIGTIGIVDSDAVELSNLHRQVIHRTDDVGRAKTSSAAESIGRLNPHVTVRPHHMRLTRESAGNLIADYDIVVDGSDNYATRYAVNDACASAGTPWVYGSVERFAGQLSVFDVTRGPCYRCVYPEAPPPGATPSCDEIGVLGAVPGVVGALQATEVLKMLLGVGEPLIGRLLQIDLLRGNWSTIGVDKRPDCAACGSQAHAARENGSDAHADLVDLDPRTVAELLARANAPLLLDVREGWEWELARIQGARLMPLDDLDRAVNTLDREREIVVYCHHGTRSALAAEWLRHQGFRARNLSGGIDRWSREVDPSIRRY